MNVIDFFRRFYFATQTQKGRKIIVENQSLLVEGPKLFPGKQTANPGLLSLFKMDGSVIEIIGFKLLTKGQDIQSTSNVVQNTITDRVNRVTGDLNR